MSHCASRDYDVKRTYELHDKSAFKGEQDAKLAEMLADAQAGVIKVLVIWHSNRLERRGGRELINLLAAIHEAGCRIESVQEPTLGAQDMGGQVMTFLSGISAYEYSRNLSANVVKSFNTIKANGGVTGRAVYGYRVTGDKLHKTFTPHEPEAAVIREAARRYLEGATIDALCDDFNARGIPSPMWKGKPGKHWHAKTLAGLLRSASIAGRRVDASDKTVATFKPLISWQDHQRLVIRLDSRANRKGISPGNVAMLTSSLFDHNGHPMYRITGWQGAYYYCRKCHVRVSVDEADSHVNALYLASAEIAQTVILVPGANHDDEIARLRQDRSELDDLEADYDDRHAALTAEIRRLASLPAEPDHQEWIDTPWTEGELWGQMNDAQRRDWLMAHSVRWTYTEGGEIRLEA
jgi:DNA invertase Pin-like site-specific DNA recombinase